MVFCMMIVSNTGTIATGMKTSTRPFSMNRIISKPISPIFLYQARPPKHFHQDLQSKMIPVRFPK